LFDHIYVINLEKRRDRAILIDYKLKQRNIEYELFYAVDGMSPKYDKICQHILNKNNFIKSRGAIGLLLTYKKLLKDAIKNNYRKFLILEDDINFHHEFLLDFKNDSDVIYLGANQYRYDAEQILQIDSHLGYYYVSQENWHFTYGTYAIGMTLEFARILQASIDIKTVEYPIDLHIFWQLKKNNKIGKVIFPFLILPDVSDSDTQDKRDLEEFCRERKYNMSDYEIINIADFNLFKDKLDEFKISLRQLFYPYRHQERISYSVFPEILQDYLPCLKNFFRTDDFPWIDLLKMIEEFTPFVFVIPSYNNIDNYHINLTSIVQQYYPPSLYRIIYLDDCSDDGTSEAVLQFKNDHNLNNLLYYRQKERTRQGLARFQAYHMVFPDEFVLMLDGDDWLFNESVLESLDFHIVSHHLRATYGSYYIYSDPEQPKEFDKTYGSHLLCDRQFSFDDMKKKGYRHCDWISGHLRGAYGKLWQNIAVVDLLDHEGRFPRIASDLMEMVPVLEQSGDHHRNICQPTVIYNKVNSMKYATSYYNYGQLSENDEYRQKMQEKVKDRQIYETVSEIVLEIVKKESDVERWLRITGAIFVNDIPEIYNRVHPESDFVIYVKDGQLYLSNLKN